MKKSFVWVLLLCMLIMGCKSAPAPNPNEVPLDTAIREAASLMETRLEKGSKIALINFISPSQPFSEYVLDELSSVLVNDGVLVVVDRASLDKVRQELNFNLSGEVSDESAQEIGKILGAEAIVTGSLFSMGDLRRVMFKAIITQTAAVAVQHNAEIINDERIQALLANGNGASSGGDSQAAAYGGTMSPANDGQTGEKPVEPELLPNGTYTFYPRPRAMMEGRDINLYLEKIVIRGAYFNMYFVGTPAGSFDNRNAYPALGNWSARGYDYFIQDLDQPSKQPLQHTNYAWAVNGEGPTVTFKNHNIRRFSFTEIPSNNRAPSVFEEIVLGEPDAQ